MLDKAAGFEQLMALMMSISQHNMAMPPDELDLKLLRLLDVLDATRSVTRAADLLGQSQPTISLWLGRLRRIFNDPLWVRSPTGLLPTPRMQALLPDARAVLAGVRGLTESASEFVPADAERVFSVGMTDASHITLLPELLGHLRTQGPGLSLQAQRVDNGLAAALQSGQTDLAIGHLPWLETGFYQQLLNEQDWVCLAGLQHPRLAAMADAAWNTDAYAREAHVGTLPGSSYHLLEERVAALGLKRRVALSLPGYLGLSRILAGSDLVATLPRHIGETLARTAGLRLLPCPLDVPGFAVKQYWHARYHHDSANRWLRALVARLFQRAGPLP